MDKFLLKIYPAAKITLENSSNGQNFYIKFINRQSFYKKFYQLENFIQKFLQSYKFSTLNPTN